MRVTKIICDKCKKEITGDWFEVVARKEDGNSGINLNSNHEYCEACVNKILAFANATEVSEVEKEKEKKTLQDHTSDKKKQIVPVTDKMTKAEKIKHLYNQGCSKKYIANEVGTTENTVSVTICQLRKKGVIV